jgi:hypothetical protein
LQPTHPFIQPFSQLPMNALTEKEIRGIVLESVDRPSGGDFGRTIVEELGILEGSNRIDVAVLNGRLEGFEIKSERDTLQRLPLQIEAYSRVFDRLTVVTASRHIQDASTLAPPWVGIWNVYRGSDSRPKVQKIRIARANRCVDPKSLVQLLWRDEAVSALRELGIGGKQLRQPRRQLWSELVRLLSLRRLRQLVSQTLQVRGDWRVDLRRT